MADFPPSLGCFPSAMLQEDLTMSLTIVSIRWEWRVPRTSLQCRGRSSSEMTPALMASPMSWFRYATASETRHIWASRETSSPFRAPIRSSLGLEWDSIPSLTSQVRLRPRPFLPRYSTIRRLWAEWWNPSGCRRSSSSSPRWPNGVCPRSWPRPMASARSSLRLRALAMVRAIWVTSRVWVRRVTK